jgi:hypothetical protein
MLILGVIWNKDDWEFVLVRLEDGGSPHLRHASTRLRRGHHLGEGQAGIEKGEEGRVKREAKRGEWSG